MSCTLNRLSRRLEPAPTGFGFRFMRHRASTLAVLLFTCALSPAAWAQENALSVQLPDGRTLAFAVHALGTERYVSMSNVNEILRAIDPAATAQWSASTGVYRAQAAGHDFSLYQRQAILLCNNAMIETRLSLVVARGQVFVPLDSIGRILKYFDGVSANIPLSDGPAVSPAPVAASRAVGTADFGGEAAGAEDAGAGVPPDFVASVRGVVQGVTPVKTAFPNAAESLKRAAERLANRRTLVLDPEPADLAPLDSSARGAGRGDADAGDRRGADLTLRIAVRCRELLAANPSVQVVLTRGAPGEKPSMDARLQTVNVSEPMAVVCLRVDTSRFKAPGGYRIYAPHRATDPSAPDAAALETAGQTLPAEAAYLPYETASLLLARFLDDEMTRGGLVRAPAGLQLAPFYLLKRAAGPSVSVSLGYETNDADRARLGEPAYVEAAAASLAQGILHFARWLDRSLMEMPS